MRSEREMFNLILETAQADERIRAVMLNGSRANPNAPKDPFQDFDIIYFVTDQTLFTRNLEWIRRFGELMILQLPDDMVEPPPQESIGSYAYLMQFMDGNRIDLTIFPIEHLSKLGSDSLSIVLLDKDGIFSALPPSSDQDYRPTPPSEKAFADCCNEFWWVSPYAAKGLWRGEITYAKHTLEVYIREELMKMLAWQIGVQTNFQVSPGKMGKYYSRYLDAHTWQSLLTTYTGAQEAANWAALYTMGELFRMSARIVAEHFGYKYPEADDARVSAYLRHIQALPRDAKEIY